MAKISLRAYNQQIEGMIDHGQTEEAIAHCKYILKIFPKHIETYRLLAKAYIESQRYSEAADVLQRILSVIPDDFISQIGMSIIREDEGNMDGAIYHMERAFEVKPSNSAVQDELRRLYGRRDGVQPPRVRLTRGALVRMYSRGKLFSQAIAEARAALAEDPQRLDIECMLAQMLEQNGEKIEAIEIANRLVNKLPFCLEANQILARLLPETSRSEDAQLYQQRVNALDPYSAFLAPATPTSQNVSDNAVTIDQLDYIPSQENTQQPDWARTVGVNIGQNDEALPDWLNVVPAGNNQPTVATPFVEEPPSAAPQSASTEFIPDWMRSAGWQPGEPESAPPVEQAFTVPEDEIAPAEIPDWLKSMAPEPSAAAPDDQARLDMLDQILPQAPAAAGLEQPAFSGELPDWMKPAEGTPFASETPFTSGQPVDTKPVSEEAELAAEVPEWLAGLGTEQPAETPAPAEPTADVPEWLAGLGTEQPAETPTPAEPAADVPEWLAGLGTEQPAEMSAPAEPAADVPEWLAGLGTEQPAETPAPTEPAADVPEWLAGLGTEQPAETPAPVEPAAEVPEWLAGLGTEQPVETPAPVEPAAEVPEWLAGLGTEQPAVTPAPAEPAADVPEWLTGLGTEQPSETPAPAEPALEQPVAAAGGLSDDEAAFAWLEALAAKQGAQEGLLTTPEERVETPPEWVQKAATDEVPVIIPAEQPLETVQAQSELPAEEEALASQPGMEQPEWMSNLPAEKQPGLEIAAPTTPAPEIPDWLAGLEIDQPVANEPQAAATGVQTGEEVPTWISDQVSTQPVESAETAPELPEWLTGLTAEQPPETAAEPVTEPVAEAPDWLTTPTVEPGQVETPTTEQLAVEKPAAETGGLSDDEAAFAWLEALAAKQGAQEGLLTKPEERVETPPDWVQKAAEEIHPAVETVQPVEAAVPAEPVAEVPEWLSEQPAEPAPEPVAGPVAEVPDWLAGLTTEQPVEAAAPAEPVTEVPEWLSEQSAEPAPEPVAGPVAEVPDWLAGLTAEQPVEAAAPAEPVAEVPEWLSEQPAEVVPEPAAEPVAEVPDWLAGIEAGQAVEEPLTNAPETVPSAPSAAASDEDAAFAWLEALAARQGADEGLLTTPEERVENTPEWVQKLSETSEAASVVEEPAEEPQHAVEAVTAWQKEFAEEVGTAPAPAIEEATAEPQAAEEAVAPTQPVIVTPAQEEAVEQPQPEPAAGEPAPVPALPDWLVEAEAEIAPAQEAAQPPAEVVVETPAEPATPEVLTPEPVLETAAVPLAEIEPSQAAAVESIAEPPAAEEALPAEPQSVLVDTGLLAQARDAIAQNDTETAAEQYTRLIDQGGLVEEVIRDLREALYRHPVDVSLWTALGDAHRKQNQVQDALDAYTKAEELLR